MTHEQATKDQATERYLLGELPENERDAFEEHYFECAVCADDVRAASTLVGTMRVSARQAKPFLERQKARGWRKFAAPLAAAASLAIGILSMQFAVVAPMQTEVAALKQPRIENAIKYTLETVRGPGDQQVIDHRRPCVLDVDVQTKDASPRYDFVVVNAGKQAQFTVPVPGEQARNGMVPIRIEGGTLQPGNYTLEVHGSEAVVGSFPFVVR
jgi:hypothetical protein